MTRILILSLFFLFGSVSVFSNIRFIEGDLALGKELAAREGKLVVAYFKGDWCMPCRWMEKNTFPDPALSAYTTQAYIAVKIDIEVGNGLSIMQQNNVTNLPTLLVFSAQGKELNRHLGAFTPAEMKSWLQTMDLPQHRVKNASYAPTGYQSSTAGSPYTDYYQKTTATYNQPKPNTPSAKTEKKQTPNTNEAFREKGVTVPSAIPAEYGTVPSKTAYTDPGPYKSPKGPYTVQVGCYNEYVNAQTRADRLQAFFKVKTSLQTGVSKEGAQVFRVVMGEFASMQEAQAYLQQLRSQGVEGYARSVQGQ